MNEKVLERINYCIDQKDPNLRLSVINLYDEDLSELSELLKECTHIRNLDLSYNNLGNINTLLSLTSIRNLQSIDLSNNNLYDLEILEDCSSLVLVDLSDNEISEISFLKNLTLIENLNLSGNSIKDYSPISSLNNLKKLELDSCKVVNLNFLYDMSNIDSLSLRNTSIYDLSSLRSLNNLKTLDLSVNNLKYLSAISDLKKMTNLHLDSNLISDLSFLKKMKRLKRLHISRNPLQNIDSLSQLKNLEELYFDESVNVKDLRPIKALQNLRILSLAGNNITEIDFLGKLESLEILYLENNQIKSIKGLSNFISLRKLFLANNKIDEISSLSRLLNLKTLDVRNNLVDKLSISFIKEIDFDCSGVDIFYDRSFVNSEGLFLDGNPMSELPLEYLKQGKEFALNYLREHDKIPLNECKIILVGRGKVGKTSLQRRIVNDLDFDPEEKETHGIRKVYWEDGVQSLKNENIRVNFWDFGGQHIQQTLHQFFYSENTLYILVLDKREDESPEDFLELIKAYASNAPVIIVYNNRKSLEDKSTCNYDLEPNLNSTLYNKYKNIRKVIGICAGQEEDEGIESLRLYLKELIPTLEFINTAHPKNFIEIKQILMERTEENYIMYDEYQKICADYKLDKSELQEGLIKMLNDVGTVTYFEVALMGSYYILNPDWVTTGIYQILLAQITNDKKGIITKGDVDKILKDKDLTYKYKPQETSFLMELMRQFSLCYSYDDQRKWLIPSALKGSPKMNLRNFSENEEHRLYCYHFPDAMPMSVIHRFIARNIDHSYNEDYWENGIVVKHPDSETLLFAEADKRDKEIRLWIKGEQIRDCWQFFRKDLREFSKKFKYEETIKILSTNGEKFVNIKYGDLIACKENGIPGWFIPNLGEIVNVSEVLNYFEPLSLKKEIERKEKEIRVFLACSEELESERRDFEIFIGRENKKLRKKSTFIELIIWEDFIDAMAKERLQDEYNKVIQEADVFVSLFFTKVGPFTTEEFESAHESFIEKDTPKVYTFFKNANIKSKDIRKEFRTVLNFKDRLNDLGHFVTDYEDSKDLHLQFKDQLEKLGYI